MQLSRLVGGRAARAKTDAVTHSASGIPRVPKLRRQNELPMCVSRHSPSSGVDCAFCDCLGLILVSLSDAPSLAHSSRTGSDAFGRGHAARCLRTLCTSPRSVEVLSFGKCRFWYVSLTPAGALLLVRAGVETTHFRQRTFENLRPRRPLRPPGHFALDLDAPADG